MKRGSFLTCFPQPHSYYFHPILLFRFSHRLFVLKLLNLDYSHLIPQLVNTMALNRMESGLTVIYDGIKQSSRISGIEYVLASSIF